MRTYLVVIPLLCFGFVLLSAFNWTRDPPKEPRCVQPAKLVADFGFKSSSHFFDEHYANYSAEMLGGAVRIATESFDDMAEDPEQEPRFQGLAKLREYLFEKFPLCADRAVIVNEYGLLFTFQGSSHAKPALYMSHMDVVPVNLETVDQWEYEPFSGKFDGEWVHGRGASDTKNTVVGILEAIEALLVQGWQPKRTIVVAYGFDEEISGFRGAGKLAAALEKQYGRDSFELIVDEGFGNLETDGIRLACPLVTERGYLDVHFELSTPGGHSSLPPHHTGIGILSDLIVALEERPFEPSIKNWRTHPAVGLFQCVAEYTDSHPKFFDLDKRANLLELEKYITAQGGATQYMIRTSQAVDLISGGVKVNALPELVRASVNYRVSLDETTNDVLSHVKSIAASVCKEMDVGLVGHSEGAMGNLTITHGIPLEAAPISPWSGPQWDLLGGVMRRVFEDLLPSDEQLVISPSMMTGNTDTRHYWNLSSSIYRYSPVDQRDMVNYHTVGEKLRLRAHLATVAWYYELTQWLGEGNLPGED